MKTNKQTENWVRQKKLDAETPASMDSRILMDSYASMPAAQERLSLPGYRRLFMKTTVKFAAAAIVLIAAFLSLTLFNKTVAPAYAFEQTVRAQHSVRTILVKDYLPDRSMEPKMFWAEFYENGQVKAMRVYIPQWDSPADGPKDIVVKDNVAQVWIMKKNALVIARDKKIEQFYALLQETDPKYLVGKLETMQQQGIVQIKIQQPDEKSKPIQVTATFIDTGPQSGKRYIVQVDQATKLALSWQSLQLKDNQYEETGYMEFLNYNQPFEDDFFTLKVPDNVMKIDRTSETVGLEQGQMSSNEVAIEVVRRFWQAIIDDDYETAGQLAGGIPGPVTKAVMEKNIKAKATRIISVGPVKPHSIPATEGVIVPCIIEVNKNGQVEPKTFEQIGVRQIYGRPDRWVIFSGI